MKVIKNAIAYLSFRYRLEHLQASFLPSSGLLFLSDGRSNATPLSQALSSNSYEPGCSFFQSLLHPNENPSLILVSPPLNTSNYHSCSRSMRMALLSKNKLMFIDETIPTPQRFEATFANWDRCNNLVLSWILKSLSPTIAQSVVWFDLSKDVWCVLRIRFEITSESLISKSKFMSSARVTGCH